MTIVYVDRNNDTPPSIKAVFAIPQYEDQESIDDSHADVVAFRARDEGPPDAPDTGSVTTVEDLTAVVDLIIARLQTAGIYSSGE